MEKVGGELATGGGPETTTATTKEEIAKKQKRGVVEWRKGGKRRRRLSPLFFCSPSRENCFLAQGREDLSISL